MVELTNRYRASWGLSRLKVSPHLQEAAEWFAADKAHTGSFDQSHYDSLGRFPDERFADFDYPPGEGWTENLAAGSASPFEILEAWRQSPAHDANLRYRAARVIGVGLATNPRDRDRRLGRRLRGAHRLRARRRRRARPRAAPPYGRRVAPATATVSHAAPAASSHCARRPAATSRSSAGARDAGGRAAPDRASPGSV